MEIIIITILLLLNGMFAMFEIALVSSSKAKLETTLQQGKQNASKVLKLLEEPEKILSTIQIGITLIGIVSGAYGGLALAEDLTPLFAKIPLIAPYSKDIAVITVVGLITYFSLIIGELVPKSLALQNPENIAIFFTPFMLFLTKITYPVVWLLSVSTRIVNKLFGIKSGEERQISEEEIKYILKQSSRQGIIDKQETEMIKDVFSFVDKQAGELMTHRKDIVYLCNNYTKEKVLEIIEEKHFSKYLLCQDNDVEQIKGVVAVKDIISLWNKDKEFNLSNIATDPLYIPETLSANKVLEIFKQNKTKFGVVVNEYGTIEGILTLHDLTEAILGEIPEENEETHPEIIKRKDGSLLVDGAMDVEEFMDYIDILPDEKLKNARFSTLSGFAMHELNKVPVEGDTFVYNGITFEVVDMDNSRVDKLMVKRPEPFEQI